MVVDPPRCRADGPARTSLLLRWLVGARHYARADGTDRATGSRDDALSPGPHAGTVGGGLACRGALVVAASEVGTERRAAKRLRADAPDIASAVAEIDRGLVA
jgi:hypothetical protein